MATRRSQSPAKSAKKVAKKSAAKKSMKKAGGKRPRGKASKPQKKPFQPTEFAADGKTPLLAGGNPQIPKGDGDAPVEAYIAAMPGWKNGVGRRLDDLIVSTVPEVQKAMRWNSPFYGIERQGWFVSFHCFTKYVKLTFFKGSSLKPPPPGTYKDPDSRYLNIHEDDEWDEEQLTSWFRQAAKIPGWIP